jgi:Co/Zn/Cd efflux system component
LHRAELVGAFFNGIFLLALALSIFLQSIERFINIESVNNPLLMLVVGCVGLSLNIISASIVHGMLHPRSKTNTCGLCIRVMQNTDMATATAMRLLFPPQALRLNPTMK